MSIAYIISHHWDKDVGSLWLYDTVRPIKILFLTEGLCACVCEGILLSFSKSEIEQIKDV